jgi:hypothetical protein
MKTKRKQKKVSIKEYIETYCQEKRMRERSAVYISPETNRNLKKIAGLFASEYYTTASSLADSISTCHFEEYWCFLRDKLEEKAGSIHEWLEILKQVKRGEPEIEPEMQSETRPESQPDGVKNKVESIE